MDWSDELQSHHRKGIVEIARLYVSQFPGSATGWQRLGEAYLTVGNAVDGLQTLREACENFPRDAKLHLLRARCALLMEDLEEALSAVERSLQLAPEDLDAHDLRFNLLVRLRDWEEAKACSADVSQSEEMIGQRISLELHLARERNQWGPLLALCERVLEGKPGHTSARYHRALALLKLERCGEAEALLDPSRFLSVTHLEPPAGQSLEAFTLALQREILANPTLTSDPRTKATRHGLQTQQLRQPNDTAIPALLRLIRAVVDRYAENLDRQGGTDGFVTARPQRVRMASWAVVYPGEGRQRSHIHPSGWVSGVFYVCAPRGGHLLLGAYEAEDIERPPWEIGRIQPVAGLMALFPSFTPHATEPTHSEELRICVAFDVLPA